MFMCVLSCLPGWFAPSQQRIVLELLERVDESFGRGPVPTVGNRRGCRAPPVDERGNVTDALGLETEQRIGAVADGHGPFRVVTQGEAGDAQERRLLLDAAGVREDRVAPLDQAQE